MEPMIPKYSIAELRELRGKISEIRQRLKNDGSTRCTECGGFTAHFENCPAAPDAEEDQRQKGDDDGVEYSDPRDERDERRGL